MPGLRTRVENGPNFRGQRGVSEWFRDQLNTGVQPTIMHDCIAGISCRHDEILMSLRSRRASSASRRPFMPAGKSDVRKQQVQ